MADSDFIAISLTQGYFATVDLIDADLAAFKWKAQRSNEDYVCATRNVNVSRTRKTITIVMHRLILERKLGRALLKGEECDHWDTNPLNNRRENLRLATRGENMRNVGLRKDNTSGYKGVVARRGRWHAQIQVNGKNRGLGTFDTPEEAYVVYCAAAKELHGAFARVE